MKLTRVIIKIEGDLLRAIIRKARQEDFGMYEIQEFIRQLLWRQLEKDGK